jgi:NAD(P)-dependent dehydrogenase (short-subunit alcohol dehydrogenase family)
MQIEEYFRDKVCIVTGAASGIGLAVSGALLQAGALVVMSDRDTTTLASAVAELRVHVGRVHSAAVDVTKQEQVKQLIQDTAGNHGRLDLLFNNAGIGCTMPIAEATMEHWRRVIDINLWGVIYGIDAALPIMRRQRSGHIVNTASIAGLVPFAYQEIYAATKYAVVGLTECLRFELADDGIAFSVVCPGDVATRIYGTPVIGERHEVKPPDNAIPAVDAAQMILTGVSRKEGIIALPDTARQFWRQYCTAPEQVEADLHGLARQRRESLAVGKSYYGQ